MLLFRSEEHVRRWLGPGREDEGAAVSLEQGWRMAVAWFGNRLDRDWQRTPDRAQRIFDGLGLSGPFWHLPTA